MRPGSWRWVWLMHSFPLTLAAKCRCQEQHSPTAANVYNNTQFFIGFSIWNDLTLDLRLVLPLQEHIGQHSSSTVSGYLWPFMSFQCLFLGFYWYQCCVHVPVFPSRFCIWSPRFIFCYSQKRNLGINHVPPVNETTNQLMNQLISYWTN